MAYQHTLPSGTVLHGTYRLDRRLGQGGFANTYLAFDEGLQREVAIKEFFPNDLVVRTDGSTVQVKAPSFERHFKWAQKRFVDEAKRIARFHHPNIVRIFDTFDENHTSYIVLEFVKGANMEEWLKGLRQPPSQDELDILLARLLDALQQVHGVGMLHRDVKPTNVYIREDGSPVLLDFGSARELAPDAFAGTGSTHAIVSRGYSPHEAYSADSKMQGPWTDVYGLAATIYRALSNAPPIESTERVLNDAMVPTTDLPSAGRYRRAFLRAIDHGLAVMPKQRPQSVAAWRAELFAGARDATRNWSEATESLATTPDLGAPPSSRRSSRRHSAQTAPEAPWRSEPGSAEASAPQRRIGQRPARGRARRVLRLAASLALVASAGWGAANFMPAGTLDSIYSFMSTAPPPSASGGGGSVSNPSDSDRRSEKEQRKAKEREAEQARLEEREQRKAKDRQEEQARLEEREQRKAKEREAEQARLEEREQRKAKDRQEEEERKSREEEQARLEEREQRKVKDRQEGERKTRDEGQERERPKGRGDGEEKHKRASRESPEQRRPRQPSRGSGSGGGAPSHSTVIQGIQ
jgi:serine/threonine protein kinase